MFLDVYSKNIRYFWSDAPIISDILHVIEAKFSVSDKIFPTPF